MNDLQRFKKLLEFFVSYLEYCHHNPIDDPQKKTDTKGFAEYIHPLLSNGVIRGGQGWKSGHHIQDPLSEWDKYYDYEINIAADARTKYVGNSNYLTWNGTAYNIIATWSNEEIVELKQVNQILDDNKIISSEVFHELISVEKLGLFDGKGPNTDLENFYINYYKLFNEELYRKLMSQMKAEKYKNILEKNHNMVLTGAPGTGKTYLAKTIAQAMNAKFEMVQFHPSYDYTDFVEGLRPTPPDNNGNIGFTRTNGVFRKFCEKALKSKTDGGVDNFDASWDKLIEALNDDNKDYIDIPMVSGKSTFRIELNEYGTGLATRTYENDEYEKGNWIKGKSKFFSKDQLYNVYRGMNGIPSGGHDNYRKAVIVEMKKNFDLKEYQQGLETQTPAKYVFIMDEINRGELSKIFGELFFSIDPGYRGAKGAVKTQYSNMHEQDNVFDEVLHNMPDAANYFGSGWFFVPDNVYIIGTMNDIDRSVESMDFAMRRRFTFCEITAEQSANSMGIPYDENSPMKKLNDEIVKTEGLGKDFQIGGAYLKDYKDKLDDITSLQEVWNMKIGPLVKEYLRGIDNNGSIYSKFKESFVGEKAK